MNGLWKPFGPCIEIQSAQRVEGLFCESGDVTADSLPEVIFPE